MQDFKSALIKGSTTSPNGRTRKWKWKITLNKV